MKEIPTRKDIAESDTWDLSPLFVTEDDYRAALAKLKTGFERIGEFRGRLASSAQALVDCLEFEKSLDLEIDRLRQFASLRVAEDSSNTDSLARRAELSNLLTRIHEACAFVTPEIQAIPDEVFASYLADPGSQEWQRSLQRVRRFRPHTLSEAEERLLASGASCIRGHGETFSQLTNVDMRFGEIVDEQGTETALSQSNYIALLHRSDRRVREQAFHRFYQEFADHQFTLASSLAASVRADVFYARARRYPSAREASLFPDRMPIAVYDNLITTVRENLTALHDYYALRQEVLGLAEIHQYDVFVPLVAEANRHTPFQEATAMIGEALQPLGPEYAQALQKCFHERWIDRYETKGKRSGAFSSSSYRAPAYILMNYKPDVLSDVFTLAHEAGHSMHSWFAQNHQLFQDYDYPIFLAEVASTFNEELLTDYLLNRTDDPLMRAYLIDRQIEDIRGTFFRQTMFAEFEMRVHAIEEAGGPLTLETFKDVYHELLVAYFGPGFTLDPLLDLECLRIPHFYSAFYVYKYATGISAAIALAQRVRQGGAAELNAYLSFLRSGGSQYPLETLASAGVDMSAEAPIEAVVELFRTRVQELRSLLAGK